MRESEQNRGWQPPVDKTFEEIMKEIWEGQNVKEGKGPIEIIKQEDQGDFTEEE